MDDYSRVMWLYLLKHKSDVSVVFKSFYAMVCTQFNTKLQILRSDNGGDKYLLMTCLYSVMSLELYTRPHAQVLLNKMGWLNEKTNTF